ncbi:hypothetical protein C8R43DRAFT_1006545 [Mycena crocata]|nr:hypothetical protein C8R43DRAFT_1006545 [Mycena crocata]
MTLRHTTYPCPTQPILTVDVLPSSMCSRSTSSSTPPLLNVVSVSSCVQMSVPFAHQHLTHFRLRHLQHRRHRRRGTARDRVQLSAALQAHIFPPSSLRSSVAPAIDSIFGGPANDVGLPHWRLHLTHQHSTRRRRVQTLIRYLVFQRASGARVRERSRSDASGIINNASGITTRHRCSMTRQHRVVQFSLRPFSSHCNTKPRSSLRALWSNALLNVD